MIEYRVSQSEPLTGSGMPEVVSSFECRQVTTFGFEYRTISYDVAWTFGTYLTAMIARRGLDKAEFGRRVGHERGTITNITKDRRTPPPGELEAWATALDLRGRDRQMFMDLATAAHLPKEVRPHYLRLIDRLERDEALGGPSPPSSDPQ